MSSTNWSGQDWQERNDSRKAKYGYYNIYEHRWMRPDTPPDAIYREFSAEVLVARRRAGAKMIAEIKKKQAAHIKRKMDAAGVSLDQRYKKGDARVATKARLRKMSGSAERRIKAIRGITTAAGSVIMLDHAPLAYGSGTRQGDPRERRLPDRWARGQRSRQARIKNSERLHCPNKESGLPDPLPARWP